VETGLVTAGGSKARTYRETYRLPRRQDHDALVRELSQAAASAQGRLLETVWETGREGRVLTLRFGFAGGWAPVTLVFRAVEGPRIALVLDDAGYVGDRVLEKLWGLRIPATVAVIPGLPFSLRTAQQAPSHGWEVICHMPMEGHEAVADGVYRWFLRRHNPPGEVSARLDEALAGLPHCRGMNNHMGSRATQDLDLMLQVGHALKRRGMYFLDSRTTDRTVALEAMRRVGVPSAERGVFLDNEEEEGAIRAQLRKAGDVALRKGGVVAIGHVREATLRALAEAVPEERARGVEFVYLSELVE
jgi:polysaccharide deacetylase 2 family uncharacterized protein YibQ